MAVTEHIGYGRRIKNAFAGVLFGILMFVGSFVLHAFNERNAIRETKAINEIETVAIANVPTDSVNEANEGKLVHMKGSAATEDRVKNQTFGIDETAIRLNWDSSIYQLVEKEKKEDDKVTYTYSKEWKNNVVDSSRFKQQTDANQGSQKTLPGDGRDQARNVDMGVFQLNDSLIGKISGGTAYPLTEVPNAYEDKGTIHNGMYWTGNPTDPQIGDEKIEFNIVRSPQDVTVMAQQNQSGFVPYQTKIGKAKEILYMGLLSKEQVIDKQRHAAFLWRWGLRGLGFLLMWMGLGLIAKPLAAIASILPFGGRIVGSITGFISFLIAACLSLLAIATFWFAFRPLLSGVLIVGAVACAFAVLKFRRTGSAQSEGSLKPPPPPPPAPAT